MREIKLKPQDPHKFRCHTDPSAKIHLYECAEREYALVKAEDTKVLYAFESESLTNFLEQNMERILEASLYECECRHGSNPRTIMELRLQMADGHIVTVTDWERIYRTRQVKKGSYHAKTLYSPYSAWSIPPEIPYVYMLLTGRLVDFIDSIAQEGQHKHLLHIIWQEHRILWEKLETPEPLIIEAEFMKFKATPMNQYLIAFDIID